jgi:cyd operon protein YbgT
LRESRFLFMIASNGSRVARVALRIYPRIGGFAVRNVCPASPVHDRNSHDNAMAGSYGRLRRPAGITIRETAMWYFTWILGIGVALGFGIINVMWLEASGKFVRDPLSPGAQGSPPVNGEHGERGERGEDTPL